jgi:hypothetical protein
MKVQIWRVSIEEAENISGPAARLSYSPLSSKLSNQLIAGATDILLFYGLLEGYIWLIASIFIYRN